MKIRVAAPDTTGAGDLARRLVEISDDADVRVDGAWAEVNIGLGPRSDRILARVLRTIENWLRDAGVDSAVVEVDDRVHFMAPGAVSAEQARV